MNLFDQNTPIATLNIYLSEKLHFLNPQEKISHIKIAGEGNMNVVLRLITNERSFILKQSRPFVNKYPDIAAPVDRIDVEYQFYKQMGNHAFFPNILNYIAADNILILEDLGDCEDLTSLYQDQIVSTDLMSHLIMGLHHIHSRPVPKQYPKNTSLRELNHQHIFVLPFVKNNSFSLNSVHNGLETLAVPFKKNKILKKKITETGELYLKQGDTLLHGDYYPGSWMKVENKLYIIDPEFSFCGPKEFDVGIMAAHLILATGERQFLNHLFKAYPDYLDQSLVQRFCGIEILRRLIGLAQLPLKRNLEEKQDLLDLAEILIIS